MFAFIAAFCLTFFSSSAFASTEGVSFDEWYEEFRRRAVSDGIRVQTLDMAFKDVRLLDEVIASDRKQPEFRKNFQTYLDNAINDRRIKKSRQALIEHRALLRALYAEYGVSPNYLIAFWAMETDFGRVKGNLSVFSSLTTLAYDTRRSDFFARELMNALFLAQKGMDIDSMKGSWAGAMGNFQFMPTTYLTYGRDYDGDGTVDLSGSLADAMASAANYLASEGWRRGRRWGREVVLPKNFDWDLIDVKKTVGEWRQLGVSFAETNVADSDETQATLILPAGVEGPAFLAYSNFFVITRWNRSLLYALSVGHLADRMAGGAPFKKRVRGDTSAFSFENAMEMQTILKKEGLYSGEIDGILGAGTRAAVRDFQRLYDLPPDGFSDASLLGYMRLITDAHFDANALSFDDIVAMQKILANGMYYKGPFDGKLGNETKNGVAMFAKVYNIRYSKIDRKLLAKMRVHARRNMENGDVEPVVRAYHEKREAERRRREKARQRARQKNVAREELKKRSHKPKKS